ncbi:MAG TPA: glycosyltransferase [Solirubrobacteraceae bacterium]
MTKRALLVSTANPYPVVRDGCQRLVDDYVDAMFPGHELYFLHVSTDDWSPLTLFREGRSAGGDVDLDRLLAYDFEFVMFVGFKDRDFTRRLTSRRPSFCYTDRFPHPDVPAETFRGILSHRSVGRAEDILLVGGSFDETVFYPDRKDEDLVLAVGRIHPDKNQLELVSRHRETIFEPFGLPLYLAGGVADLAYYHEVRRFIDGISVMSSIVDASQPFADCNWCSGREIAALCNRARLYVSASPKESFSLAMIEAMACGTTCVVNGDYWGFAESQLRPHVHGNITAKRGSVVELAAEALRDDVRIDASQWARRYSLGALRDAVVRFIDERV